MKNRNQEIKSLIKKSKLQERMEGVMAAAECLDGWYIEDMCHRNSEELKSERQIGVAMGAKYLMDFVDGKNDGEFAGKAIDMVEKASHDHSFGKNKLEYKMNGIKRAHLPIFKHMKAAREIARYQELHNSIYVERFYNKRDICKYVELWAKYELGVDVSVSDQFDHDEKRDFVRVFFRDPESGVFKNGEDATPKGMWKYGDIAGTVKAFVLNRAKQ